MSDLMGPEDVAALKRGEQLAWARTYDRLVTDVYAFIAHLTKGDRVAAEEVHQETWLAALRGIRHFSPRRADFRQWLFGIARKQVAWHYRRKTSRNRRLRIPNPLSDDLTDGCILPADVLEHVERASAVQAALAELGREPRQTLIDKYVNNLSVKEIAMRTGKTPKAVESMLSRARSRMRSLLAWYFENDDPRLRSQDRCQENEVAR